MELKCIKQKKILKFACISVLASSFLHASSLKESVEKSKQISTNPEVISQKINNQEALKNI